MANNAFFIEDYEGYGLKPFAVKSKKYVLCRGLLSTINRNKEAMRKKETTKKDVARAKIYNENLKNIIDQQIELFGLDRKKIYG